MMRHVVAFAGLSALAACQSVPKDPQLIAIARPAMGGEALFHGTLAVRKGCVVALGHDTDKTVLFDPGVSLTKDHTGIVDPRSDTRVRLGVPITGGAAFLRDDGNGWPISDVERFYGVIIPRGCPTRDIMRLHGMKER